MNYRDLEKLGRVRLSENFFMREFLHSEVANYYRISNIPVDPDLAIENGSTLCEQFLEPLQNHYGRIFIRSGYRSPTLNNFCHRKGLGCASNERNYARHIWDLKDQNDRAGAMACIVIPEFLNDYEKTKNTVPLQHWIAQNLPECELKFFKYLAAFNIGWKESYMQQKLI